jgi:hypothetical protein
LINIFKRLAIGSLGCLTERKMMELANSNKLAKTISVLTNPALLVSVTLVVFTYRYTNGPHQFWLASVIGVSLLLLPGMIYSAMIWFKEGRVDLDLTNRQERIVPLMLSCLGAIIGAYLIQTQLHSLKFVELAFVLVTLLLALTVITTVWKISLHAASLAALVSILIIYRGELFAFGYLLLIPIAWAKLTLRQHTTSQLIVGTLLGAALTFVAVWFFSR